MQRVWGIARREAPGCSLLQCSVQAVRLPEAERKTRQRGTVLLVGAASSVVEQVGCSHSAFVALHPEHANLFAFETARFPELCLQHR